MDEVLADALTQEQRDKLKDSDFAVPGKRELPIHNKTHIKLAWDMVDNTKDLTDAERKEARKRILAAAKKAGMDTSDWESTAMTDSVLEQAEILLDSANPEDKEKLPPGVIMRLRNKGTRVNFINEHKRLYAPQVITDSLERRKGNWQPMEYPHPQHYKDAEGKVKFRTSLENRVGRIHGEPWMDDDGWVWFDSDIYDTTKGRNIAALARAGEPIPVSMRSLGLGAVQKVINDSLIKVPTLMDIHTFDYVDSPATEGCGTAQIVLTDSQMEAITDGLGFSDPVCPIDGTALDPFDPDKDGDVDFWACPKCASRYDVYNGLQVTTQGNQRIYRRWDSPDLGTGRTSPTPPPVPDPEGAAIIQTDSQTTQSEGAHTVELTAEQIQQMIKDANAPFQAILDSQQQQAEAQQKKQEAQAFLDSKYDEIKANYTPQMINAIKKAVGEQPTAQAAEVVLDSVLDIAGQMQAADFLSAMGFTPGSSPQGRTSVQVTNEPKPWQPMVDEMLAEFDRIDTEKGKKIDYELRKFNKPLVDKVIARFENSVPGGYQVFKDSMDTVDALLDSASVTTAQILNQPTIQTVILIEKFQDLVATQFMMTDVFEGSEMRVPSESFQSAEAIDPATFLYDIVVAENTPIPEAVVDLVWASFTPKARRNAISLTSDVIRAMATGPAKYDAPARGIYHIGKEAARMIDSYAYWDMAVSADEYLPLVVTNESVTCTAVSNGTNVVYKGQLTLGGQAGTQITNSDGSVTQLANQGFTPIVRPRTKQVIQANGTVQSVTTNTIVCKVGGTTLVQGGLDKNGNIVGSGAQFAINFETGDIYFVTGLGIVPGTTNPIISYSASTNYDIWSTKLGSGYTVKEQWYNTFLMQLTNSNATMASNPRYNPANLALMSLANASYIRNAEMFYKWAQPNGVSLNGNQGTTQNFFGTRDEIDLYKLNAPWTLGDYRVLLHQKNATRYGIQTPYKIEGPIQKQDGSTGRLLPVKAWYGEEFSCICTPQIIDANGNVLNPTSRTIRIVNY